MEQENSLPALQSSNNYSIAEVQPVSTDSLIKQVQAIQHAMKSVMEDGVHYGKIPGCGDKPALLKPGAEKIGLMFRLGAHFDVQYIDLHGGHREIKVICTLKSIQNGQVIGQGVGSCSTMESKYRYAGSEAELTSVQVPKDFWKNRDVELLVAAMDNSFPAKMLTTKKVDGAWLIAIKGEKAERKDLADVYNTILKMAKKRAHVDAIITATAAGDIFTQDIEDGTDAVAVVPTATVIPATVKPITTQVAPAPKLDDDMPAMDRQPPEPGIVSYNIPYKVKGENMEEVRALLKSKKFRFNPGTKFWDGREVVAALAKYRVIDVGVEEEEQPPIPEQFETDEMLL